MNIKDYYLDINRVFTIDKEDDRRMIYDMYNRLIDYSVSNQINDNAAISFFNTLTKSGYLKNKNEEERAEKIDIING